MEHCLSRHTLCWMNDVTVRRVHWVHLVPVSLLSCYQHHCSIRTAHVHFKFISSCSERCRHCLGQKLCLSCLRRETCCHGGSLFTGNGRLVQCYQGSQVPLPTGGLPRGKRRGGKGDTEAGMEIAMAFCNTPGFV